MKMRQWQYMLYFTGFLLMMMSALSCSPSLPEETHKIVVLQSYEPEYRGYTNIEKDIVNEFHKQGINADIDHYYLDCESYQSADELKRMIELLDTIQALKPEIILVYDDQATYSLLASQHAFAREVPIIFAGVNFPNWNLIKKYPNVTGFWDRPEYVLTARMSERIFGPMRINYWTDETFLGRQATSQLMKELYEIGEDKLGSLHFNLKEDGSFHVKEDPTLNDNGLLKQKPLKSFYYLINARSSTSNQLLWTLSGLSRNSIFIQTKRDYTSKRLGLLADNPTLTTINEGFGYGEGLLGGYITPIETQTQISVEAAVKVLRGVKVDSIPITQSPKVYIVDWNDLSRWGIPRESVPDSYQIIDMPFFERYKSYIITIGLFISILIISIICYLTHLYLKENNQKRQTQRRLKESERFLSLALTGGKVFAFQLNKNTFYFDSDFHTATGLHEDLISIEKFRFFIHPDDKTVFDTDISNAYSGNNEENISQIRCKLGGDTYQWWEFRYTYNPLENTFSGLCLNIQKAKAAEQELVNARKKAEESDQMKSAFLANMSHEIRTPLNAIVGFSNIIGSGEIELEPSERNEFLQLINANCELLLKLINDILDLSRIESGHMVFNFENCNLTDLMDDIFRTHQLLMPQGVELRKNVPDTPCIIHTDRHRLTQVITNFINNAAKFTSSGYIEIKYTLSPESDHVLISVRDTGKGIAKEKQTAVFERFQKLDEFAQGTGLGLAICKTIIKRFDGMISVESREGEGSTFTITLPILPISSV